MRTNVYVDAFNLYYGCLKDTPYRWLDIAAMCRLAVPRSTIHRVKLFSARVAGTPHDQSKPERQAAYFRALQTTPRLTLNLGHFLQSRVWMPHANPPPPSVEVWKTSEKGSDVNLAAHLLMDGFKNDYEAAIVITNDSDLAEPVRMVRTQFHLPITVLHPLRPGRPRSVQLRKAATASLPIDIAWLIAAQFPPVLQDPAGTIHKPSTW